MSFDEQGNLVFTDLLRDTPNLTHFSVFLQEQGCALLAGS